MAVCERCGSEHVGTRITGKEATILTRRTSRLVKIGGGEDWAIRLGFFRGHPDVNTFVLKDQDIEVDYRASRQAFLKHAVHRELNGDDYLVLPHRFWQIL